MWWQNLDVKLASDWDLLQAREQLKIDLSLGFAGNVRKGLGDQLMAVNDELARRVKNAEMIRERALVDPSWRDVAQHRNITTTRYAEDVHDALQAWKSYMRCAGLSYSNASAKS